MFFVVPMFVAVNAVTATQGPQKTHDPEIIKNWYMFASVDTDGDSITEDHSVREEEVRRCHPPGTSGASGLGGSWQ